MSSTDFNPIAGNLFLAKIFDAQTYGIQVATTTGASAFITTVDLSPVDGAYAVIPNTWPAISGVTVLTNLASVSVGGFSEDRTVTGYNLVGYPLGLSGVILSTTQFDTPVALAAGSYLVLPVGGIVLAVGGVDVNG